MERGKAGFPFCGYLRFAKSLTFRIVNKFFLFRIYIEIGNKMFIKFVLKELSTKVYLTKDNRELYPRVSKYEPKVSSSFAFSAAFVASPNCSIC